MGTKYSEAIVFCKQKNANQLKKSFDTCTKQICLCDAMCYKAKSVLHLTCEVPNHLLIVTDLSSYKNNENTKIMLHFILQQRHA